MLAALRVGEKVLQTELSHAENVHVYMQADEAIRCLMHTQSLNGKALELVVPETAHPGDILEVVVEDILLQLVLNGPNIVPCTTASVLEAQKIRQNLEEAFAHWASCRALLPSPGEATNPLIGHW